MIAMKKLLALLIMVTMATATIQLVTPKHIALESLDEVVIAPVGPGHDVFLKFQRKTENYVWDEVNLINIVDPDWQLSSYNDYEYIYYIIHVPTAKASGKYTFQFEVRDKENLRDPEIAIAQVVVTYDQNELVKAYPMPERLEGFAAEELVAQFNIENKALSRVRYMVTSSVKELPSLESTTSTHSFLSGQTKEVIVPVTIPEEGEYTLISHLWSEDNPTIDQTVTSTLIIKPTFRSKLQSIGKGFPLVPLTMAPFYAFLGLFGW